MNQITIDELFSPDGPLAATNPEKYSSEADVFYQLRPSVEKAMSAYWIPTEWLLYEEMDIYSSVYLKSRSNTLFRIRLGGNRPYISVPQRYAKHIPEGVETWKTSSHSGYICIALDDAIADVNRVMYENLTDDAIMSFTSDIACCGLYKKCSDARKCLRASDPTYLGCAYRKNLKAGKVFYGNAPGNQPINEESLGCNNKGKSIIALPTDYVVIDIETTGLDYKSCEIIEVAAIRYIGNIAVDRYCSLVKPHPTTYIDTDGNTRSRFVSPMITWLTGITNDMLEAAPEPNTVLPELIKFIGDSILIGHNVHFDINFLYNAIETLYGHGLTNNYIDTLRIAKKVFPDLEHHQLSDVAAACHVEQVHAHRAEADCLVTGQCYDYMRAYILKAQSEEDFIKLFKKKTTKERLSNITPTVNEIDSTNPIYGKVIVFTGALSAMTRPEAFQRVINLGGIPEDKVTRRSNYLVIGDMDFTLIERGEKSSKIIKAENYISKGQELSILSESTFFDLIADYM